MTATMERGLTNFERELSDAIVPAMEREHIIELADELEGNGITDVETFEDALFYRTDCYHADEEFAEYLFTEIGCNDIPDVLQGCIDWQVVWDSFYRFDFWSCCINGETFYFHIHY
jgi:hypothetical protein